MVSKQKKLVNFFVIGVVKGGTTSLYHYLSQHPDIFLPPIKETNHFAQNDINSETFLPEYRLDVAIDLDSYLVKANRPIIHIAHVNSKKHYELLFRDVEDQKIVAEISNSYMVCPSTAEAIAAYNPEAKVAVILRNPITRAFSQFLMNLRESKAHSNDFIKEITTDAQAKNRGWGSNHQYLELGNYARQLSAYYNRFPTQNIHVILYEEYRKNPHLVLQDLCTFLGVNPNYSFNTEQESNAASLPRFEAVNKVLVKSGAISIGKKLIPKKIRTRLIPALYSRKNLPELTKEQRNYLITYYKSEMHQLDKLLQGRIRTAWPEFFA